MLFIHELVCQKILPEEFILRKILSYAAADHKILR